METDECTEYSIKVDIHTSSIETLLAQYNLALTIITDDRRTNEDKVIAHNFIGNPLLEDVVSERLKDVKATDPQRYLELTGFYAALVRKSHEYHKAQAEKASEAENTNIMYH